jgi:hypothetical protein
MSEFIYKKYSNINTMHILQISLQKIWNTLEAKLQDRPMSFYQQAQAATSEILGTG